MNGLIGTGKIEKCSYESGEAMKKHTKRYAINLLVNVVIIFVSYIFAVLIRYYIFKPDLSLDPLSPPFLIIAGMYAVLMAFTLDYEEFPRTLQGDEVISGISRIVAQNVIGCIVLFAVFFVTGIINFSRWAIFILGIISSIGLIIKRVIQYSRTARKRCAGEDQRRVLIVGDGSLAEEYIKAITNNPQFGIKIVGYLGTSGRLQTNLDSWFEPEKYPFPEIRWLGEPLIHGKVSKADIEKCSEEHIDEIVVTDESDISEVMNMVGRISISLPHNTYISHGSKIRDLGDTKTVRVNENVGKRDYSKAGMVISVALLLIILLMKKFDISSMNPDYTLRGVEKSRSIVFGLLGFFIYWGVSNKLDGLKLAQVKCAGITCFISTVAILIYELFYGGQFLSCVLVDLIPVMVVIGVYFVIKEIIKVLAESYLGA